MVIINYTLDLIDSLRAFAFLPKTEKAQKNLDPTGNNIFSGCQWDGANKSVESTFFTVFRSWNKKTKKQNQVHIFFILSLVLLFC
jgi:hypothetical protein